MPSNGCCNDSMGTFFPSPTDSNPERVCAPPGALAPWEVCAPSAAFATALAAGQPYTAPVSAMMPTVTVTAMPSVAIPDVGTLDPYGTGAGSGLVPTSYPVSMTPSAIDGVAISGIPAGEILTADEWCYYLAEQGNPCPAPEDFGFGTVVDRFARVSWNDFLRLYQGGTSVIQSPNGGTMFPGLPGAFDPVSFLPGSNYDVAPGASWADWIQAQLGGLITAAVPRLPLPGAGAGVPARIPPTITLPGGAVAGAARGAGAAIRAAGNQIARGLKTPAAIAAALAAAGWTGAQIAEYLAQRKGRRRHRGITASQLTGFKRVSRMLCDFNRMLPSASARVKRAPICKKSRCS